MLPTRHYSGRNAGSAAAAARLLLRLFYCHACTPPLEPSLTTSLHSTQAADGAPPLTGVRVVEVCGSIAGAHCGKLLAHMGAEVTKVEPPEGDPARGHGAFPGGAPHEETSALFLHLNANKRSATLAVGSATGRAILDRLAAASDVLVYDAPELSDTATGAGELVRVAITPFGLDGPNAGLPRQRPHVVRGGRRGVHPARQSVLRAFPRARAGTRRGLPGRARRRGAGGARGAVGAAVAVAQRVGGARRPVEAGGVDGDGAGDAATVRRLRRADRLAADVFLRRHLSRHRRPRGPLPPRGPALGGAVRCDGPARPRRRSQVRHLRRAPRPPSRAQRRDACVGRRPGEADDLSRRRVERLPGGALRRRPRCGRLAAASRPRLLPARRPPQGRRAGVYGAGLPALADAAGAAARGAAPRRT